MSFDEIVLPHLDAAHRLARWLIGNEHDAEDAVQEASLRAFRYLRTFSGRNGRAWFLRIVRNTCWSRFGRRETPPTDHFDGEQHSGPRRPLDPEALLLQADNASFVGQALSKLPDRHRELLVLRELDGLSYRELADVLGIPIGTVMSGLSRARQALRAELEALLAQPGAPGRTGSQPPEALSHLLKASANVREEVLQPAEPAAGNRQHVRQKEDE